METSRYCRLCSNGLRGTTNKKPKGLRYKFVLGILAWFQHFGFSLVSCSLPLSAHREEPGYEATYLGFVYGYLNIHVHGVHRYVAYYSIEFIVASVDSS